MKMIDTAAPQSNTQDYQSDAENENVEDEAIKALERIASNFKRNSTVIRKGRIVNFFLVPKAFKIQARVDPFHFRIILKEYKVFRKNSKSDTLYLVF